MKFLELFIRAEFRNEHNLENSLSQLTSNLRNVSPIFSEDIWLKVEFQCELNHPRVVAGCGDAAEVAGVARNLASARDGH